MISKLKSFIEVSKTKNISKAADNLYTSQPSISMKIKSLEDELGVSLFDRTKKMMILTEEGKVFLHYAEGICNLYEEATNVISDFKELNRGNISISTGAYYGAYLMPSMLGKFKSMFPNINIQIKVAFSEVVIQDIIGNYYELGFIGETDIIHKYPSLVSKPFLTDELVLVCSRMHPYAHCEDPIDLNMLRDETFIKSDPNSALRGVIEGSFNQHNIHFRHFIILNNVESIKRSVENNLGISILPKLSIQREVELGFLCTIPFRNMSLTRKIYYVHRNDKTLSRSASEFLRLSIEHFSNLPPTL